MFLVRKEELIASKGACSCFGIGRARRDLVTAEGPQWQAERGPASRREGLAFVRVDVRPGVVAAIQLRAQSVLLNRSPPLPNELVVAVRGSPQCRPEKQLYGLLRWRAAGPMRE